jgi:hypothetical protein
MGGADLSPPTICLISDPELFDPELLRAISRSIDWSIVIGIIIWIQVWNVRRAITAIIIQEAIGF